MKKSTSTASGGIALLAASALGISALSIAPAAAGQSPQVGQPVLMCAANGTSFIDRDALGQQRPDDAAATTGDTATSTAAPDSSDAAPVSAGPQDGDEATSTAGPQDADLDAENSDATQIRWALHIYDMDGDEHTFDLDTDADGLVNLDLVTFTGTTVFDPDTVAVALLAGEGDDDQQSTSAELADLGTLSVTGGSRLSLDPRAGAQGTSTVRYLMADGDGCALSGAITISATDPDAVDDDAAITSAPDQQAGDAATVTAGAEVDGADDDTATITAPGAGDADESVTGDLDPEPEVEVQVDHDQVPLALASESATPVPATGTDLADGGGAVAAQQRSAPAQAAAAGPAAAVAAQASTEGGAMLRDLSIKVTKVEELKVIDGATPAGRFLGVHISVENTGAGLDGITETDSISLSNATGSQRIYDPQAAYVHDRNTLAIQGVNVGSTGAGMLVFDVGTDFVATKLNISDRANTDGAGYLSLELPKESVGITATTPATPSGQVKATVSTDDKQVEVRATSGNGPTTVSAKDGKAAPRPLIPSGALVGTDAASTLLGSGAALLAAIGAALLAGGRSRSAQPARSGAGSSTSASDQP